MGIKGLHPFLRKKCISAYKQIHLSEMMHKKVAVDVSLFLYKYKAIFGDRWMKAFLTLIMALRRNQVHCVFIYDTGCCQEKLAERERRKEGKEKLEDKSEELKYALDEYARTKTILPIITQIMGKRKPHEKIKRLLGKRDIKSSKDVDIPYLENYLERLLTQNVRITKKDIADSKELFEALAVPYFNAELEAETLCAILTKKGIVHAALSEDTDLLAYGCTVFMHGINTSQDTCMVIKHEDILEQLELSALQFTDLCIMCGTDYNDNIPKVGPVTSYKLLVEHGTLDDISAHIDTSQLKYPRVRELFDFQAKFLPEVEFCGTPDWDKLSILLFKNNCRVSVDVVRQAFRTQELVFED